MEGRLTLAGSFTGMLFNSLDFFIFFPVVTSLYFLFPYKYRWFLLLLASCLFYAYFIPAYILILFTTIIIDYLAAIFIENETGVRRKTYLIISIIVNIGFLTFFKYYNFFVANINEILLNANINTHKLPYLNVILPIGLSFHTFQSISYTIEVYKHNQKAERHFGIYSLYVMYYPQLVAGPIERPQNMIHQFREKHDFEYRRVVDGLKLMVWGMFKKVVIADSLALVVTQFYTAPQEYSSLSALFAIVCFSFQIYCDFSGYSDIAIGASKVMGIQLMKNFNQPYLATSIGEFWQRWHISLSTWFRDYLYIPLGGNRQGKLRTYINLFIVFILSGLWHGANWTFIIWGGLHGAYLVVYNVLMKYAISSKLLFRQHFTNIVKTCSVFMLVTLAWIFFRASSADQAFQVIKIIFGGSHIQNNIKNTLLTFGISSWLLLFLTAVLVTLFFVDRIQEKIDIVHFVNRRPLFVRWCYYFCIVFAIVFMGIWGNQQFIYFQF